MPFLILLLAVAVAVGIRMIAGRFNHTRIREYIWDMGGTVIEISWHPFGPGWFGEQDSAIYIVNYRDHEGNTHSAYCKTGMHSGVYLTQDVITNWAVKKEPEGTVAERICPLPEPVAAGAMAGEEQTPYQVIQRLREETRRLRAEVEELRREKKK